MYLGYGKPIPARTAARLSAASAEPKPGGADLLA
jgi:hypothetical protein